VLQTTADTGKQRDRYISRALSLSLPLVVRGRSPTDNRQKVGKKFSALIMARTVRGASLATRSARLRLAVTSKPYWRLIEQGLHLGYRRRAIGGSWIARRRNDEGVYRETKLGDGAMSVPYSAAILYSYRAGVHARSTARHLRSAKEHKARAPSWVARRTTRGAWPASNASCQRDAHKHQRSPDFNPGKPNSGTGVERSLPRDFEKLRNAAVITAQTV
jgi:hypothetical protein